jgi:hypothetical protein
MLSIFLIMGIGIDVFTYPTPVIPTLTRVVFVWFCCFLEDLGGFGGKVRISRKF